MINSKLLPFACFFCCFTFLQQMEASTIHVPDDYPTIQSAIDEASTGDTVLVAPGTYLERLKFRGKDIVLASHFLTTGDPAFIEQTIIDAEQVGIAILLEEGESEATEITGFTIMNGSRDEGNFSAKYGGGIVCLGTSPQIRHNHIKNAWAVTINYFGGIVCSNSRAIIEYNRIDSIFGAFVQKVGGVVSHKGSTIIQYNHIENITGGYVFQVGGGIMADSSQVLIKHNLIDSSSFDSNVRQGGIALVNTEAELYNNTVVHHLQGIRLEQGSEVQLTNNIIYYNGDGWSWEDVTNISIGDAMSILTANHNNIEDGWEGETNLDTPPLFIDKNGDYHLQAYSPCIDQGDPNSPNDPDGTRSDMGVFYFEQLTPVRQARKIPNLAFSPNPASNEIYVRGEMGAGNTLDLYDIWGRLHLSVSAGIYGYTKINVNRLPTGIYLLRMQSDQGLIAQSRLVIN